MGRVTAIVACLLVAACDGSSGMLAPTPEQATISITEANPPDGNGVLNASTAVIQHYVNQGVEDLDRVTLSAYDSTNTIRHEIEVLWVPATAEVRMVQHFWAPAGGETSGATRCAAGTPHVCPRANVSADAGTRTITFNAIVLHDLFGGSATSTLTGSGVWEDGFSDGGDH